MTTSRRRSRPLATTHRVFVATCAAAAFGSRVYRPQNGADLSRPVTRLDRPTQTRSCTGTGKRLTGIPRRSSAPSTSCVRCRNDSQPQALCGIRSIQRMTILPKHDPITGASRSSGGVGAARLRCRLLRNPSAVRVLLTGTMEPVIAG